MLGYVVDLIDCCIDAMDIRTTPDFAPEAELLLAQDLYRIFTSDITQPTPYRRSRHRPL